MFCRAILRFYLLEYVCHKIEYLCNKIYLTILEGIIKCLKQYGINRIKFWR
ncbi:Uncharacterized protein PRO82_000333 [Candidatus Protochlamydia amoebophila]|nr:Uncharacterized protein [Candidatus Protochlamydia amoebophila]